nr:pantothenate kinase 1 [Tanacetum cinerariifolium]
MLVGDIYGGMDYSKIGLTSTAIASSFGKAVSEDKELEEYKPEDVARSLLRMISNNIGQIAYLNALRFGLKKIFFGGFFIGGHAYTMDTISVAVDFW